MSPPSRLVYIVDDDDHVRHSTVALLKAADITSLAFASGNDFLASHDPAVGGCLLLDLHMPGLSGLQVLNALRQNGHAIPVVLFTDRTDPITEENAKRSGASALLAKPVAPADLIEVVRDILAQTERD